MTTSYRVGPYAWNQTMSHPVLMLDDSWACGLNLVTGKFEGAGEAVRAFTSGGWWYLGGSSLQQSVATEAHCM